MSNERMMLSDFGGFTPSDKLREVDKLEKIIEIEPDISEEIERIFNRKGIELPEMFKPPKVFEIPPKVTVPFDPFPFPQPLPLPTPAPAPQPTPEIDTRLQFLLNAIPIAHPGNLITSEYHNALRDAVRALASRIGLEVNPATEFKILTFAPNFQSSGVEGNLDWKITINNARVPPLRETDTERRVSGGMVVQLPDNAQIYQMIVRGEREDVGLKSPDEFQVSLNRMKFGKEKRKQTLISMDLKDVLKDSREIRYFEAKETVKLSDDEAGVISHRSAATSIADRKIVSNESWVYFVTADWVGGAAGVAKFDIHSIQIICRV